jgi:hypothetical protein
VTLTTSEPPGIALQAAKINSGCFGFKPPAIEAVTATGKKHFVRDAIDRAFPDHQAAILRECVRSPQAFFPQIRKAFEVAVAFFKAAQTGFILMGEDGIGSRIHTDPPLDPWAEALPPLLLRSPAVWCASDRPVASPLCPQICGGLEIIVRPNTTVKTRC